MTTLYSQSGYRSFHREDQLGYTLQPILPSLLSDGSRVW